MQRFVYSPYGVMALSTAICGSAAVAIRFFAAPVVTFFIAYCVVLILTGLIANRMERRR